MAKLADCIRGGLQNSISAGVRKADSTISGVTGDTGYDMVERLARNSPKGLQENMRGFRSSLKKGGTLESIYYNNLLSNPTTLLRNLIGNTVELISQTGERGIKGITNPAQTVQQFAQFKDGLRYAWDAAGKAWATGVPAFLSEEAELAAMGGVEGFTGYLKTFPHLMAATDDFFTTLSYHMDVQDRIYKEAFKRAKTTGNVKNEVIKLLNNVPEDIHGEAIKTARRAVFRDLPEGKMHEQILKTFSSAREIPVVGRFIVPFVKTPINLAKRGMEYTPLNAVYGIGQMISSGNTRGQLNVLRGGMGTLMMAGFANLGFDGLLTGDGSHLSDGERNARLKSGWQPNSFKFGNRYVSYRNLGPITTLMTIAGQIGERAKDTGEFNIESFYKDGSANVLTDTLKGVIDSTFLPQVVEMASAIVYSDRYGAKGVDNLLRTLRAQVLPTAVPSLWRAIDPTIRDDATLEDYAKAPVKSALGGGKPKLGLFGEEIKRTGLVSDNFADIFMNPLRATQISSDPLVLEVVGFQDAGLEGAGFMPPNVTDRGVGFKDGTLTEDEKFTGAKAKGFLQRLMMENVMSSGNYASIDPQIRLKLMRRAFDRASKIANQRIRNLKRNGTPIMFRDIVKGYE